MPCEALTANLKQLMFLLLNNNWELPPLHNIFKGVVLILFIPILYSTDILMCLICMLGFFWNNNNIYFYIDLSSKEFFNFFSEYSCSTMLYQF